MNVFTIDVKNGELRSYTSIRGARNSGNGRLLWASPTELMRLVKTGKLSGADLLSVYNASVEKPITSFKSNEEAAEALFKIATKIKPEVGQVSGGEEGEDEVSTATETAKKGGAKKATDKKAAASKPRKSDKWAGKTIVTKTKENKRKPGSKRHKAQQIIIDAGAKGITYEDFIKKGGNAFDLGVIVDHSKEAVVK